MKAIVIAGTVITNKGQAINLLKRLNRYFDGDRSYEMAIALDDYTERLVNAGFLTWEEADAAF